MKVFFNFVYSRDNSEVIQLIVQEYQPNIENIEYPK